jgi:hypothetical protein
VRRGQCRIGLSRNVGRRAVCPARNRSRTPALQPFIPVRRSVWVTSGTEIIEPSWFFVLRGSEPVHADSRTSEEAMITKSLFMLPLTLARGAWFQDRDCHDKAASPGGERG